MPNDSGFLQLLMSLMAPEDAQADQWGDPQFVGPPDLPDVIHDMAASLPPPAPNAAPTPTRSLAEKLDYALSLIAKLEAPQGQTIQAPPQGFMPGVNTIPELQHSYASTSMGPPKPPSGRYIPGVYNYPR